MVHIDRLAEYTLEDAANIGRLMPGLSDKLTDDPIDERLLREIVDSDHHDMLVARDDSGRIVGVATLSLVLGPTGRKAHLEDFVVGPDMRGKGVSDALWQAMADWCLERGAALNFTSNSARTRAHQFYLEHGATVRETTVFKKDFSKD